MRCGHCGKNNPEGYKQCVYCGQALVSDKRNKSTRLSNLIVAMVIILVIVVAVFVVLIAKRALGKPGKQFVGISGQSYSSHVNEAVAANNGLAPGTSAQNSETENFDNEVQMSQDESDASLEKEPPSTNQVVENNPTETEMKPDFDENATRLEDKARFSERAQELEAEEEIDPEIVTNQEYYERWDSLLNDVYQYLKQTLPSEEFRNLKKDEINWIKEKEAAIEAVDAGIARDGDETALRNAVAVEYTQDRCDYLISLI